MALNPLQERRQERGLPSPDVAHAFVLTFAEVGRGRQKVRRTRQASWRVTGVGGVGVGYAQAGP